MNLLLIIVIVFSLCAIIFGVYFLKHKKAERDGRPSDDMYPLW